MNQLCFRFKFCTLYLQHKIHFCIKQELHVCFTCSYLVMYLICSYLVLYLICSYLVLYLIISDLFGSIMFNVLCNIRVYLSVVQSSMCLRQTEEMQGSHSMWQSCFVCVSDKHQPVIFVFKLVLSAGREFIPAYHCDGLDVYSAIKC